MEDYASYSISEWIISLTIVIVGSFESPHGFDITEQYSIP